jgi:hypothetical protein
MNCSACFLQLRIVLHLQEDTTRNEDEVIEERRLIRIEMAKKMATMLETPMKAFDIWDPPMKLAFQHAFQILVITGVRACPCGTHFFQTKLQWCFDLQNRWVDEVMSIFHQHAEFQLFPLFFKTNHNGA